MGVYMSLHIDIGMAIWHVLISEMHSEWYFISSSMKHEGALIAIASLYSLRLHSSELIWEEYASDNLCP